jgi:hypothetical protein
MAVQAEAESRTEEEPGQQPHPPPKERLKGIEHLGLLDANLRGLEAL